MCYVTQLAPCFASHLGDAVRAGGMNVHALAAMQELNAGCGQACPASCSKSLQGYLQDYEVSTGYALDDKSYNKLLNSCTRRCNKECSKGGTAYDYVISYRRY
jgi:hypothetical protein